MKMNILIALGLVMLLCISNDLHALDNGLALTPPMGWLQWERYRCITDCETYPDSCVNEKLFMNMADRLAEDGYRDAGYKYVNIDDCWAEHKRDSNNNLVADKKRFPSGLKALGDYIHSKGLKFGIYGDFGTKTCAGYPGSLFYMQKDAEQYAEWGVDMVKLDGCNVDISLMDEGYPAFGKAMNMTGRKMLYSCSWPAYVVFSKEKPDYERIASFCNMWRNYDDISDNWDSVTTIIKYYGDKQDDFRSAAGPGHWNDPDMLLIGDYALSEDQSRVQFGMWSIMASPLFMSADLRAMKPWQKDILLNKEIIAVNQDPLGQQGQRVHIDSCGQVWRKDLKDGSVAVALFNSRTDYPVYMEATFQLVGIKTKTASVRDLFEKKNLGTITSKIRVLVNANGIVLVTVKPIGKPIWLKAVETNEVPY